MSLFGKLKSAVMGNLVTKEFEVGKHIASAGPGLLWKVHTGVKKSTRKEVSLFLFDKKTAEFEKQPKKQREAIIEMLKKGPTQLIRLRHPRLLTIEHPIEESNDLLAFATEPVFASLANLLGHYDNMPSPLPLVIKEFALYPVELQYGLLQVAEALHFLHKEARMMHGNLTPQSVAVTKEGGWKVMGFNFSCFSQYQSDAQTSFAFKEWDSRKPLLTNPSLDFLAPEYILTRSCSEQSDIFSYSMLCFAVYNEGRPLFLSLNNLLTFKQNAEQVSRITEAALGSVPEEFKPLLRSGLAIEPSVRPDALQITKHPFFEEVAVATLKYLDMLYERGDMEKSQFFKKNLARVITKLPKRVVHQRVLPALSSEFRNPLMVPFILPLVLLIAEDCSIQEYTSLILPVILPALRIKEPIQVPLILLQKMELLLKKTPQEDIKRHILPMIVRSLEAEHGQLQELCVSIIPSFAEILDYSSMKHSIIPRITALCISTGSLSLRVKCLVCVGQMLPVLDKHIVLDHVLPVLQQIPSKEPGVLMAMLGIFHQTMVNKKLGLDKTMLATRILPFLLPLSIESGLNVQQFNQFLRVIREMLQKVESEHQSYLEQLSTMEEQTKSTVQFAQEVSDTKAMDDALNRLEDMFVGSSPESRDPAPVTRRGTSSLTTGGMPPGKEPPTSTTGQPDLLAGLSLGEISSTHAPAPSASQGSMKQIDFGPSSSSSQPSNIFTQSPALSRPQQSPLTGVRSAEIMKPMSASSPAIKPSLSAMAAQKPGSNTGYTPPTVRQNTGQTGNAGLDMLSGTASMGSMGAAQGVKVEPSPTSMFSGMQVNSAGLNSSMVQSGGGLYTGMQVSQPSGGAMLQPMVAASNNQQPGHMTGSTNQSGMSAPLVPMQTGNIGGASAGWSSNINNQPNSLQGPPNAATWSTDISSTPAVAAGGGGGHQNLGGGSYNAYNNSQAAGNFNVAGQTGLMSGVAGGNTGMIGGGGGGGGGWSQNIGGGHGSLQSGMQYGMGAAPVQGGTGMSQQQYATGTGVHSGMGGVQPQQYGMGTGYEQHPGMGGWNQATQMQQPSGHMTAGGQPNVLSPRQPSQQQTVSPTPGDNPFADLSFLS